LQLKLTKTELELALALKYDELINIVQAELDNERQYQVNMEYLWAHDRELISTLRARIEDLELELYDMNALYGQVKDGLEAKLAKAVKAAFSEGFLAATEDGWTNNPRIETEWKRSEARTTLAELNND
jgi:hypothetical protein